MKNENPKFINELILNKINYDLEFIDLEKYFFEHEFPVASNGRINWHKINKKEIANFNTDAEAAK